MAPVGMSLRHFIHSTQQYDSHKKYYIPAPIFPLSSEMLACMVYASPHAMGRMECMVRRVWLVIIYFVIVETVAHIPGNRGDTSVKSANFPIM